MKKGEVSMEQVLYLTPGDDVQSALDGAPAGAEIHLAAGVYRQKILLSTPEVSITGEGAENTVLVWGDYAKKRDGEGREYNTFRTWTLAVCADGVSMGNLSVVNDALSPEEKGQEVALSVYGDRFTMDSCVLSSTQDTLFLGPLPPDLIERYRGFLPDCLRQNRRLRQRFTNCRIEGTVDFIFGCGEARFTSCEIRSLRDARNIGFVAAPAHGQDQAEGFRFEDCAFTCDASVEAGSIFLARPWRDYGLARFENCTYGPHIAPAGFDPWEGTRRDRTARFYETPPVPGRVPWAGLEGAGESRL